jgi:hypothetical protein
MRYLLSLLLVGSCTGSESAPVESLGEPRSDIERAFKDVDQSPPKDVDQSPSPPK